MNPSVTKMDIHDYKDRILREGSLLKRSIYKNWLSDKNMSRNSIFEFLSALTGILSDLDNNINEIRELFRRPLNEVTEIKLKFEDIKDFVYGNFDYPSVLQYADGLYMGMSNGTLDTPSKINDFYLHTISAAFYNMPSDPDELVERSIQNNYSIPETVDYDLSSYKNISNWGMLFPITVRKKIYDAAAKVLVFAYENKNSDMGIVESMTEVHAITSIVDYIVYTVLLHTCRIYSIFMFSLQFVEESVDIKESSDLDINYTGEDPKGEPSIIFQITDELIIRDHTKFREFLKRFFKFIETTSGKKLSKELPSPTNPDWYVAEKVLKTNRFIKVLKTQHYYNIFQGIANAAWYGSAAGDYKDKKIEMINILLNPKHGISTEYSARHEFLNVLKGVNCDYYNLADCRDCALDLYVAALVIGNQLTFLINHCNTMVSGEPMYLSAQDMSESKSLKQIASLLAGLYAEIMMVVAQRAAFIERVINAHLKQDLDKAVKTATGGSTEKYGDLFQISNPSDILKELVDSAPDAILCAAPDTTRMPPDMDKIYHLPAFEYFEFCDQLLQTLPEFKDLPYFTEAAEDGSKISQLINKIMAMIQEVFNKAKRLFVTDNFKAAQKWVIDHKEKLLTVSFDKNPPDKEDIFNILDYKDTIGSGTAINLTRFKSFMDSTNVAEAAKDVAKWKADCYKAILNESLAGIFTGGNKNIDPAKAYKNMLLYNNATISNAEAPSIKVDSNEKLHNKLITWISTVEDAAKLAQQYASAENVIKQITSGLKNKVSQYLNASASPKKEEEDKTAKENDVKVVASNDDKTPALGVGGLVSAYHEVIANTFIPLIHYTNEAVLNQYKYIQYIYNKGAKKA